MSWSISLIGTPAGVCKRLDSYAETLGSPDTSQSRREFDDAKPALQALVSQNVGTKVSVKLAASGHASFTDGAKTNGNISVAIDQFYGEYVTE